MTKTLFAILGLTALAGCATGAARSDPSSGAAPTRVADGAATRAATDSTRPAGRAADIEFMRHMVHHHAQALEMTALVSSRTAREDLRRMAQRIDVSQRDEIELMSAWLRARGGSDAAIPAAGHGEHAGHDMSTMMPGMLGAAQMERLRAASGPSFDRLFLEGMIQHHEGAIQMVAQLFRTPGAGQDAELFRFASDVDADQRAEIARMRQMLAATRP